MDEWEGLRSRVQTRFLPGEEIPGGAEAIDEMLRTITDRILIQIESDEIPEVAHSVIVDATVKALRLRGYEGSKSETASDGGSISNTFIDDALASYKTEITNLKSLVRGQGSMGVKLL